MKYKSLPLIFLLSFCIFSLFFINVSYGATGVTTLTQNRNLQPVEGVWFYQERDDYIDFEEYYEGSTPNVENGGLTGIKTGVYQVDNPIYTDIFGNSSSEYSEINRSYVISSGFNNSGASWSNIDFYNNETVFSNSSGLYQAAENFKDYEEYEKPGGNWTITDSPVTQINRVWNNVTHTSYLDTGTYDSLHYRKNLAFIDNDAGGFARGYYDIADKDEGSVFFRILVEEDSNTHLDDLTAIVLRDISGTTAAYFSFHDSGEFRTFDGASWVSLDTPTNYNNSEWYFIELAFSCTTDTMRILINGVEKSNDSFATAGSVVDRVDINTFPNAQISRTVLSWIDYSWDGGYYAERYNYIEPINASYISDVIDFNTTVNIWGVENVTSAIPSNNTYDLSISDNSTGSFNDWQSPSTYYGNSTQFLKYRLLMNNTNATDVTRFISITFNYTEITAFDNPGYNFSTIDKDKVLLLFHNNSNGLSQGTNYTFNVSEESDFTQGEVEFIFLYVGMENDMHLDGGNNYNFFTILLNDQQQFSFRLEYNLVGGNYYVNWSLWDGSLYHEIYSDLAQRYYEYDANGTTMIYDFYWQCYDAVIDYRYNNDVVLEVSTMTGLNTRTLLFENSSNVVQTGAGDSADTAQLRFGNFNNSGNNLVLLGIDSSRARHSYERHDMLTYVTKNFTAYNVEDIFSFVLPRQTIEMDAYNISGLRLKSDMVAEEFISFNVEVKGNTFYTDEFTNLDSFQSISSTVFDEDTNILTVNVKYRCKNLNEFNNTISLEVSYIYTPHSRGFAEMLMLIIPPTLMLIVPSAVVSTKYKKNGFLIMFFLMTLITMGIGMIPLIPGLLIITVLVLIFLRLMKQDKGGN